MSATAERRGLALRDVAIWLDGEALVALDALIRAGRGADA